MRRTQVVVVLGIVFPRQAGGDDVSALQLTRDGGLSAPNARPLNSHRDRHEKTLDTKNEEGAPCDSHGAPLLYSTTSSELVDNKLDSTRCFLVLDTVDEDQLVLTEADCGEAITIETSVDQELAHSIGTCLAETVV